MIPEELKPDLTTARAFLKIVEEFMNENQYDLRITENDDGTLNLRLVKKDEPCRY